MIFSLDISTACIGWCLLNDDGTYVDIGYLEFKKKTSLYEKLGYFKELIMSILCQETPGGLNVYVEAPLARSNNQNVVNLLQRWNGMCCAVIYDVLKKEPALLGQRTALKTLGIKVPKGVKGKDRKKYILQYVKNFGLIPEEKWANKKTGNPKEWCFDMADAFIVARAVYEENKLDKEKQTSSQQT